MHLHVTYCTQDLTKLHGIAYNIIIIIFIIILLLLLLLMECVYSQNSTLSE